MYKILAVVWCVVLMPSPLRAGTKLLHHDATRPDSSQTTGLNSLNQSWKSNFSYVGLPLCATGLMLWQQQKGFRNLRNHYVPEFNSLLDNYSQYSPLGMTLLLKSCGVKTKSGWLQLTVNSGLSMIFMASIVNGMKYSIRELRPDNTARNSFPSGHTATAFMCATIMHKELGHKSAWYSVSAYTVASLTGLFRILNNRHWINDVVFGAGVGITSVDLAYVAGDLIFTPRTPQTRKNNDIVHSAKPSFFMFGMSVGTGGSLPVPEGLVGHSAEPQRPNEVQRMSPLKLRMGNTTSVSVEGACFFNKYLGVGGELKLGVCPVVADYSADFQPCAITYNGKWTVPYSLDDIASDEKMGMVDVRMGGYASLPLSRRWTAGGKLLAGRSYTTALLFHGSSEIKKNNVSLADRVEKNGTTEAAEAGQIERAVNNADFLKMDKSASWALTAGVNVSCQLRKQTALRAYVNYNFSRPVLTYHLTDRIEVNKRPEDKLEFSFIQNTFKRKTALKSLSGGLSLAVLF